MQVPCLVLKIAIWYTDFSQTLRILEQLEVSRAKATTWKTVVAVDFHQLKASKTSNPVAYKNATNSYRFPGTDQKTYPKLDPKLQAEENGFSSHRFSSHRFTYQKTTTLDRFRSQQKRPNKNGPEFLRFLYAGG